MTDPAIPNDRSLTLDVLEHALAFKGNSAQVFADAVEQVRMLSAKGDIYPPSVSASVRVSNPDSTISNHKQTDNDGRLSQAEAVALLTVHNESFALSQVLGQGGVIDEKLDELLKLPKDYSRMYTVLGMKKFVGLMGLAAGMREHLIAQTEPRDKYMWTKLRDAIKKDDMRLGINSVNAVEKEVGEYGVLMIKADAITDDTVLALRTESMKYGAKLAKDLYFEALGLASKQVPYKLEMKTVKPILPKLLG